jgi:hypothetical protein
MTTIFCDEAGNTGANLLDVDQPLFVLASNDFSVSEAAELLELVRSNQGGETKFTTLRKSPDGIRRLIRFMGHPGLNQHRVVVDFSHKRFMIVTKMVDLIAETLIHGVGGDLYERGANIAMSNMLYYCMPVFCGQENTDRFLNAFVDLWRYGGKDRIEGFYQAGQVMIESSINEQFKQSLFFFTERALFDSWWNPSHNGNDLDPAIPSLFQHISTWGERKLDRFDVLHDRSKPILASEDTFRQMLALTGEESTHVGYDRRKFLFPLRAISLQQADSKDHPQIQVADLCAGIVNHLNKSILNGQLDELAHASRDLQCENWSIGGLQPTLSVTPEQLQTDALGGSNAVEAMVDHLRTRSNQRSRG